MSGGESQPGVDGRKIISLGCSRPSTPDPRILKGLPPPAVLDSQESVVPLIASILLAVVFVCGCAGVGVRCVARRKRAGTQGAGSGLALNEPEPLPWATPAAASVGKATDSAPAPTDPPATDETASSKVAAHGAPGAVNPIPSLNELSAVASTDSPAEEKPDNSVESTRQTC